MWQDINSPEQVQIRTRIFKESGLDVLYAQNPGIVTFLEDAVGEILEPYLPDVEVSDVEGLIDNMRHVVRALQILIEPVETLLEEDR